MPSEQSLLRDINTYIKNCIDRTGRGDPFRIKMKELLQLTDKSRALTYFQTQVNFYKTKGKGKDKFLDHINHQIKLFQNNH